MPQDPFDYSPIQETDPLRDFATDFLLKKTMDGGREAPTPPPSANIEISRSADPAAPSAFGEAPRGRRAGTSRKESTSWGDGLNLDMFYAKVGATSGEPVSIESAYLVCHRAGAVVAVIDATVVGVNTVGINPSTVGYPAVAGIATIEIDPGQRTTLSGTEGSVLHVACALSMIGEFP